jgi:hypothetical protein
MICKHCTRDITCVDGTWVDPEATGDDSIWREVCDANHEDRIAAHEPEDGDEYSRVIHTDAPLLPLTQMVGSMATVWIDTANAGTEGACFYGWGEARNGSDCPPHHLVAAPDDVDTNAISEALHAAGFQVVLSDYVDWSEGQAVLRYHDHHSH